MNCNPSISIILPVRNEENFIAQCLDSIVEQTVAKNLLEVLVIDGRSSDSTPEIVNSYSMKYGYIRLLNNPERNTIAALNLGIKKAGGEIIIRVDGHVRLENNYVERCIATLNLTGADNVGGVMSPVGTTNIQKAIALATTSAFGIGWGKFHYSDKEEYVDTVYLGAFRKSLVERIGGFDPEMQFNEDNEFNMRIIKNGGRILLSPKIKSYYFLRGSLIELWRRYHNYGYFKVKVLRKHKLLLSFRHFVPSCLLGSLMLSAILSPINALFAYLFSGVVGLYLAASLFSAVSISLRHGISYLPVLPLIFATLHFSYGTGFLKGILDFVLLRKR